MKRAALILASLFSISLFSAILPASVFAATNLYLSPGSLTVSQGQSFSVSVRVNTGGAKVNAVQANLSYPAEKLDFLGVSASGSAFEIQAEASGGGGVIKIGRGNVGSVSGDNLVATISFKAKVSSGSAAVSFTGGSAVVRSSDNKNVLTSKSGGSYSFKVAPPPPKPDKTAPKISGVKIINIGLNKATVTWKTNEAATSIVEYGPSKKLGLTASSSKLVKSHKIILSSKLLFPGTKYYYKVKSADKAGNVAKRKLTSFRTIGYLVNLRVVDSAGKLLENVKVTIFPGLESADTDKNGEVVFKDLAPGVHAVNVEVAEQTLGSQITVEETKKPNLAQNLSVTVVAAAAETDITSNVIRYAAIFLLVGLALVLIGAIIWWIRKKGLKLPGSGGSDKISGFEVKKDGKESKEPPKATPFKPGPPPKPTQPPKTPQNPEDSVGTGRTVQPKDESKADVIRA